MKKAVIVPIVAVLALVVKAITGIEIDQETQMVIVEGVSYVVLGATSVYGVIKSFAVEK